MIREDQSDLRAYAAPAVTDHGHLRDITAATHMLLAGAGDPTAARDLSFSGTNGSSTGGNEVTVSGQQANPAATTPSGDVSPTGDGGAPTISDQGDTGGAGADGPGGGGSPSGGDGASGSGSDSGGSLPFTGFAAAAAGAVGSGLVAAGAGVRRALRRRA